MYTLILQPLITKNTNRVISKLNIVKRIKQVAGVGLREAKAILEGALDGEEQILTTTIDSYPKAINEQHEFGIMGADIKIKSDMLSGVAVVTVSHSSVLEDIAIFFTESLGWNHVILPNGTHQFSK